MLVVNSNFLAPFLRSVIVVSAQLFEIFQTLKVQGCMEDDHSAIIKYFEHLADVEVQKGGNLYA